MISSSGRLKSFFKTLNRIVRAANPFKIHARKLLKMRLSAVSGSCVVPAFLKVYANQRPFFTGTPQYRMAFLEIIFQLPEK